MNSNSSIYGKLLEILIFFYEIYVRMWGLIYPFLLMRNFFFSRGRLKLFPHGFKHILYLLRLHFPWSEHKSTIIVSCWWNTLGLGIF